MFKIVFQSVIDSCRSNPEKFNILYHNLPLATRTAEIRSVEFDQSNQYYYGLSTNKQLLNQSIDNDNDDVYMRIILDEAERFFNKRVKELTQVCIRRLAEVCISASMSSQSVRKSYLNSEDVSSLQTYEIDKKAPLQWADMETL